MTGSESLPVRIHRFLTGPYRFFKLLAASPLRYCQPLAMVLFAGLCCGVTTWLLAGYMMKVFAASYSAAVVHPMCLYQQ